MQRRKHPDSSSSKQCPVSNLLSRGKNLGKKQEPWQEARTLARRNKYSLHIGCKRNVTAAAQLSSLVTEHDLCVSSERVVVFGGARLQLELEKDSR